MGETSLSIPTGFKKYSYNWYAVATVATALQISFDDVEAKALTRSYLNAPDTSVSTALIPNSLFEVNVNTVLSNFDIDEHDEIDIVIKPKYVKEFKIKVATLKIDKSLPKIFVD